MFVPQDFEDEFQKKGFTPIRNPKFWTQKKAQKVRKKFFKFLPKKIFYSKNQIFIFKIIKNNAFYFMLLT